MPNQIFISYSKKNNEFAHKLANDLETALVQIESTVEELEEK